MDDVVLAKAATIERCIKRITAEYQEDWRHNFTHQDALILNIERACQAAIDLAIHQVRIAKWGIPKSSADAFEILVAKDLIPEEMGKRLRKMVGFRNIAVHDYATLHLPIIEHIVTYELGYLKIFAQEMLKNSHQ